MSASARVPRLPWALLGVTVVLVAAMFVLSTGRKPLWDTVFYALLWPTLATMGALVASRQPRNPIGWLFCGVGVWGGIGEAWGAFAYHSLPTSAAGNWFIGWSWVVTDAAYIVLLLLFPTGRLLGRSWRLALWVLAGACVLAIPGQALSPANPDNPLPVGGLAVEMLIGVGMTLLLAATVAAFASVVIRFRRSTGVERLQLKQLVFAAAVLMPTWVIAVPIGYYESLAIQVAIGLTYLGLPVAAGLAVLRYRLYDIDLVIRRTLVYGALTATLAAAYLASVLLIGLAVGASDVAIAGSTLAVAALFRPARARIQAVVDRRFYRRRYDAAQTLAAFSARLRDELDIETLDDDLQEIVRETVQPAHVSLWLRKVP